MQEELSRCLSALSGELTDDDHLFVVDDASDPVLEIEQDLRIEQLRLQEPSGPYVARQLAACPAREEVLLFLDARTRVLPGWRNALVEPFMDPKVMLACASVETTWGPTLAQKAAHRQQPFHVDRFIMPGRPMYFPTCSLAVRTSAFRSVGGFRNLRSGGDADLCWRIQERFPDSFHVNPSAYATWDPRPSIAAFRRQWRRYGEGAAALSALHTQFSAHRNSRAVILKAAVGSIASFRESGVRLLAALSRWEYERGYASGWERIEFETVNEQYPVMGCGCKSLS